MSVTKPPIKPAPADLGPTKDKRRAELLAAASDIFVAKGFHESKVSDIVAAAGVAQGTFYLYFKTKTDILRELVQNCCQGIVRALQECSQTACETAEPAQIREFNVAYFSDLFHSLETEHKFLKFILAGPTGIDPVIDQALADMKTGLVDHVRQDLRDGIKAGTVRELNPDVVAEAIVGMVYHLAFERVVRGRKLGTDIRQLAEEIVDFELGGIAAK